MIRRPPRLILACRAVLLCWVGVLCGTGPAAAYVPTRTKSGSPVRWPVRCVLMSPDSRGDQADEDMAGSDIADALSRAVGNWNRRIRDCGFIVLVAVPATRALEPVSDGRPSVVFRSEYWGRGETAYDESAIGITTVWFVNRPNDATDGQITDADIELNALNYTFTNDPLNATARASTLGVADLENTLTHELGHVLGLGHTCWLSKGGGVDPATDPVDDQGNPVPSCDQPNLPDHITGATMYPSVADRAINMRVLSDDDVAGVCEAYPIDNIPTACYGFIEAGSCAFVAGAAQDLAQPIRRSSTVAVAVSILLSLACVLRRRRASIRSCRT